MWFTVAELGDGEDSEDTKSEEVSLSGSGLSSCEAADHTVPGATREPNKEGPHFSLAKRGEIHLTLR